MRQFLASSSLTALEVLKSWLVLMSCRTTCNIFVNRSLFKQRFSQNWCFIYWVSGRASLMLYRGCNKASFVLLPSCYQTPVAFDENEMNVLAEEIFSGLVMMILEYQIKLNPPQSNSWWFSAGELSLLYHQKQHLHWKWHEERRFRSTSIHVLASSGVKWKTRRSLCVFFWNPINMPISALGSDFPSFRSISLHALHLNRGKLMRPFFSLCGCLSPSRKSISSTLLVRRQYSLFVIKHACWTAHGQYIAGIPASISSDRVFLRMTLFAASDAPFCSGVQGAGTSVRMCCFS